MGGSLRNPASFCNVVGFRTTPGRVPVWPRETAWSSLSVQGPMARTVADTALMLSVMAGPDDRAPLSYETDTRQLLTAVRAPSVKGWRVAWTIDLGGLVLVDDEVRTIVERAVTVFRGLGARVEAACPDMSDVPEIVRLTRGQLMVARHADKLAEHRAILQSGLVENTEAGLALTPREIAEGELLRTRQWQRVREFLEPRDLWLTPTMAVPPFPIEHPHILEVNGRPVGKAMQRSHLTYAFSVLGLPAISIPCGFTRAGLPVGLQIVGKRRGEAAVLRAAAAFEAAQPWADRRPPVLAAGAPPTT
jgi:amidase